MPDYWPSPRSLPYGESGKMAQNGTNSFHIGAFESAWLYGPVKDVVAGYFDELAGTREMLNSRYDDMQSGSVKLIPSNEVFARLREKSEALRAKSGS